MYDPNLCVSGSSVSNSKCTQQKKNAQNIYHFQNTRCCTLGPENRVFNAHFAEEICTFLLI